MSNNILVIIFLKSRYLQDVAKELTDKLLRTIGDYLEDRMVVMPIIEYKFVVVYINLVIFCQLNKFNY